MSDNPFDPHSGDEPTESDLLVLQSRASSVLSAFAVDNHKMAAALAADLWKDGCGPRMYAMSVWVGIALSAARQANIRPNLAMGVKDEITGQARVARPEEMDEAHRVAESFVNVLIGTALDPLSTEEVLEQASSNAFDAMHDYLHEADEEDAKHAFVAVMAATGGLCRSVMEQITSGVLPGQGIANAADEEIRKAFGL